MVASPEARARLDQLQAEGWGHLSVCIAKTPYSFSTDPKLLGAPTGHAVHVREVRLSAGAGFVVLVCGDIMTMPGLPAHPGAEGMDIDEAGQVVGLF
jgi:formate--tetrahydrofolate ligase